MIDPRFAELLDAYWSTAYTQGKEGRNHDDKEGSAQIAESNLCHYVETLRSSLSTARAEGRREGLEEAAKVADRESTKAHCFKSEYSSGRANAADDIAEAIRAKIEEMKP